MSEVWLDANTWKHDPAKGPVWQEQFRGKLFDSYLGGSIHYTQNHVLRLILRVFLHPVQNQTVALDSKKRDFPIRNWSGKEWAEFKGQFWKQAVKWNNRFWLVPPRHFAVKDVKSGGRALRPNIRCALDVEIASSVTKAHRIIDVVNLDIKGVKEEYTEHPTSGTFKSNSKKYDSLDIKPRNTSYEDDQGELHTIKDYNTITHEIGHAIGLPHIGVLKARPQCTLAIKKHKEGDRNVASHLARGANAEVCYGEFDSLGLAENIMGLGTKFEPVNARPWIKTAAMHTNTLERDWSVRMGHLMPSAVS